MKIKRAKKQKAYALMMVLSAIFIASVLGSFYLKKSASFLEIAGVQSRQSSLRVKAPAVFNEVSARFATYLEQQIAAAPTTAQNLLPVICGTPPSPPACQLRDYLDTQREKGISISISCRGEGEGANLISNQCSTARIFPKNFLLSVQMFNPEAKGEFLTAAGDLQMEPHALNTYALALANIDEEIRFGTATYSGNIALNFTGSAGLARFKPNQTSESILISEAIVTNDLMKLRFEGDVSYPGGRQISGLEGILTGFETGILTAMDAPGNRVFEFPQDLPSSSLPPMIWPQTLPNGFLDNTDLPLELLCLPSGAPCFYNSIRLLGAKSCSFENVKLSVNFYSSVPVTQFFISGNRVCGWDGIEKIYFVADQYNEFAGNNMNGVQHGFSGFDFSGFQHSACKIETTSEPSEYASFGCIDPNEQQEYGQACTGGDLRDCYCVLQTCGQMRKTQAFSFTGSVGRAGGQYNIFHFPGLNELDFFSLSDTPASSNQPLDVYVPDGRVILLSPFLWSGASGELGAGFFSRDGFELREETRSDDSESLLGESNSSFPLNFSFEASLVSLNEQLPTIDLSTLLNTNRILGKLTVMGGRVGGKPSIIRYFNNQGVTRGFRDVAYVFRPNMSPALAQRVFVANLGVTILSFHLHYSNPREALKEIGLNWETPPKARISVRPAEAVLELEGLFWGP